MIPVLSVVGKSNSGKTTFLEKLIKELKNRGYKVGTIKHDVHGFDVDREGKDSWRHKKAGADSVLLVSHEKLALIKSTSVEIGLDEAVSRYLPDVDIVITEGFKRQKKPKIEVFRKEACAAGLLCSEGELFAVVTDTPLQVSAPQFDLDDSVGVADLIEEKYLMSLR